MSRALPVDTDAFRVDIDDHGVAELVFGPPGGMPAADARGHAALAQVWRRLAVEPGVRAILVRSEGRGFSAGGTMDLVETLMTDAAARDRVQREARELVHGMLDCDRPIVSAINGAAVGAGAAVALLADVSIAGERAKIIDGHIPLGVAAGDHATLVWPLLCGMAKAKFHLLTGRPLSGAEAERIGLVSLCVPDNALLDTARDIARGLASGPPVAVAATKRSLNQWWWSAWPGFEHALQAEFAAFGGAEAREGFAALKEKRAARFV